VTGNTPGGIGGGTKYLKTAGVAEVRQWTGVYQAKVTGTADPLNQQRVTMLVPQVLGTAISNWAVPAFPLSAAPPVGSIVLAMFTGGDNTRPMYLLTPKSEATVSMGNVSISNLTGATITALAGLVTTLQEQVSTLQSQVSTLQSQMLPIAGGTITGDLHIDGTLYGTGGTLTIGDSINCLSSIACTSVQDITLSQGAFLSGMTEMYTGTDAVPGAVGNYVASLPNTLSTVVTFLNTGGSGATYFNLMANAIDQLSNTVAYMQSELNAHGFSFN
jgi:hypothetical protein